MADGFDSGEVSRVSAARVFFVALSALTLLGSVASAQELRDFPGFEECAEQILGRTADYQPDPRFLGDYPRQEVSFISLFPEAVRSVELAFLRYESQDIRALVGTIRKQMEKEQQRSQKVSVDPTSLVELARVRWIKLLSLMALCIEKRGYHRAEVARVKRIFTLAVRLNRPMEYPSLDRSGGPAVLRSPIDVVFRDHFGREALGVWVDGNEKARDLERVFLARQRRGHRARVHCFAPAGLPSNKVFEFQKQRVTVHAYGRGTSSLLGEYIADGQSLLAVVPEFVERIEQALDVYVSKYRHVLQGRAGRLFAEFLEEVYADKQKLSHSLAGILRDVDVRKAGLPIASPEWHALTRLAKLLAALVKFSSTGGRLEYEYLSKALAGVHMGESFAGSDERRFMRWVRSEVYNAATTAVAFRVKSFIKAWENLSGSRVIFGADKVSPSVLAKHDTKIAQIDLIFRDSWGFQAWGIVGADSAPLKPSNAEGSSWSYVLDRVARYKRMISELPDNVGIYVFWPSGITPEAREALDEMDVMLYGPMEKGTRLLLKK